MLPVSGTPPEQHSHPVRRHRPERCWRAVVSLMEGLVYATWQTVSPDGIATFAGLIQPGSLPPGFPAMPLPEPSPAATGE